MTVKISDNAKLVLEHRYLQRKEDGNLETVAEMFRRVAAAVADAELQFAAAERDRCEEQFYSLMSSLDFLPNTPTLINAGKPEGQLAACFVLPIEDSLASIFSTLRDAVLIQKSGGGTGFSFSNIRPRGSKIRSTGGTSSGPVSFMAVYDKASEIIKQGGTRSGANMGILRVDHPDILDFINSKRASGVLTNFNLSVALTHEFMAAVEKDDYYLLKFAEKTVGKYRAREVFDQLAQNAWLNGEPGVIFLDRINEDNPTPELGSFEATNPCAEQPLLPYEACNLGSINLSNMVEDDRINWEKLAHTVKWAVRFLDDVVEVNKFPLNKIAELVLGNRKIGLGIMGWADVLFRLKIPYNSAEAVKLAEKVMRFINKLAQKTSSELAEVRGSFPNIERSIYKGKKMRNATCTTIAPTGTISLIAGTSAGIEPVFALAYTKNVLEGKQVLIVDPVFEEYVRGYLPRDTAEKIIAAVLEEGSVQNIAVFPAHIRKVFVTAPEIAPEWHVRMQAAFQKYCDNAVSKTVNLPYRTTVEKVKELILLAYHSGCKGLTVYRLGSRKNQVQFVKKQQQ
ncbi:MAG: adenosylcobalamin-dependent ribonucleoside-diphosphate reductase [Thermoanaerobacteraceae bacterium]|nr:adenosylcobalamin-dependent ribonucleoside-diphosphate reductase [Thermoanaerobacteraceae bacterium]